MADKYVFINDSFVAEDQASLLVSDLAVQRGYGIFDFFKTINGKPIFLEDHLQRFYHSIAKMHLQIKQSPDELKAILQTLLNKNNLPDSGIKMIVTGGYSPDGYTLPGEQNLVIIQTPFVAPLELNSKGMSLVTYDYQRQLSEMKTLDYSMAIWLQPFIRQHQADDVLYYHNGLVKECPRANFFMVTQDKEVITAKNDILKGVIRKNILNLQDFGFTILERDFTIKELQDAAEVFITSTTKHIFPVHQIDEITYTTGEVTKSLSALLINKVKLQF
jgi:branched-chain amino acid aminotransferase